MNYVIIAVMWALFYSGIILLKRWLGGEHVTKKEAIRDTGQFIWVCCVVMGAVGLMVVVLLAIAQLFGIK